MKKILMIDDDEQKMDPLVGTLKLYGFDVEFRKNTDGAMEYIQQNIDLIGVIILDVMMPNGNILANIDTMNGKRTGLYLYEKIRKLFKGGIIIYTVVRNKKEVMSFIGSDKKVAYLTKPQDPEDIVNKIYELSA